MEPIRYDTRGEPDPTIEQLEREIREARFTESETERYLSKKAQSEIARYKVGDAHDKLSRLAYLAGYRTGRESGRIDNKFIFAGLSIAILMAYFA